MRARELLSRLFDTAVASADPLKVLAAKLPSPPKGRCVVVGAGKAAAAMAKAVEAAWPEVELSGTVVTPYGYGMATDRIAIREAAHPVPDAASEAAAREILAAVDGLSPDDLVLALISGGGSAVMALPVAGLSMADKQTTNRLLLASGLDIRTMNAVRKRLSAIKGGKLAAAAAPAAVLTLGISDIPGDDPRSIASGPTIPDADAPIDLEPVIARLGDRLPPSVASLLRAPTKQMAMPAKHDFRMIATPGHALQAAAAVAQTAGLKAIILGDDIEGEARDVAAQIAGLALRGVTEPTVFLSGGETTVTIGDGVVGRGGRNTEFQLALAKRLDGAPNVWAIAGDTDGEDGSAGGSAGAFVDPTSLARARHCGLDLEECLRDHDSGRFFDVLGDLLITGPTRTNVNDFRAMIVLPTVDSAEQQVDPRGGKDPYNRSGRASAR